MMEICFANVSDGVGRFAGRRMLHRCEALPFEYVRKHTDSLVKVVAMGNGRVKVMGCVGAVLECGSNGLPVFARGSGIAC